jgi:aminoglycoside phosphotransferase (APT) family kinase protein
MFKELSERLTLAASTRPEQAESLTEMLAVLSELFDGAAAGAESPVKGPTMHASASRGLNEREFEAGVLELTRPDFVEQVVYPAVFGKRPGDARAVRFEASVPQADRGTGRVTVRYRLGTDAMVFGKLYPERQPRAFEVMQRLRAAGFGGGPYQAAEPLAFLTDRNFLLTRTAPGEPLMNYIGNEGPEVIEQVRRAARWLVRLHSSPLRIGPPEGLWKSLKLFTILRRITKAAAAMPLDRNRFMEMIGRLCQRAGETGDRPPVVQTHGSFHYEHVYVSEETVTVIDFDQSLPADPAKDLTFFLTMLRRRTFKRTGSVAAARKPTRAFLDEYRSHLPANMQNLAVYWGAAVLLDLFHYKKKEARQGDMMKPLIAFLEKDFDAVLSGELIGNTEESSIAI